MEKRTAIAIAFIMLALVAFANISVIRSWMPARSILSDTRNDQSPADSASAGTSPDRRESLGGWGKFKFGMNREGLLMAGGVEHHADGDVAIWYPMQIDGADYKVTAMLPHGYVEAIMLEDTSASRAPTKEDCFGLADRKAATLDMEFGRFDDRNVQSLAGIDIVTVTYNFSDGNSISIASMYSDSCRSTVTYNGPEKADQGHL